ncbi:hypothetical protein EMIHUDRAFT_58459, partial [Emiliania huxleyi CCMP1516]|uniref:Uncharacterized protein n=2 Tax=Emiliania huxleyi TaxID=2903 RepID=A0A0D3KHZ7_EMIH1
ERSRPRNALERREWTTEEDDIIRSGVKQFGYRWRRIASLPQLQGRSDDAVRNRCAGEDGGGGAKRERIGWTQAEDAIIISTVREIGHKWYRIAQRIPGRTEHAIRNRW